MPAALFAPIGLRSIAARNRIVISPMCQYSARDGFANDWHLVHLGRFALGGAGIVFVEATAIHADGRITPGDVGLWSDAQIEPLARIARFLKENGAVPAIQLAHAGRKASSQRPWQGNGPLGDGDRRRGEDAWRTVAPSAVPVAENWPTPAELSEADIRDLVGCFRDAARRSRDAGFDIVEIHGAHGYLLHEFLSPLSNLRRDAYGGDRAGRMRFPLEVVEAVRGLWPEEKPLFFRVSSVDGVEGGLAIDDTVALARELKRRGVDVIDCSSGGISGPATAGRGAPRGFGFQVPYAEQIRREAGIATMAVGLILQPRFAESIVAEGKADLVAIAREALSDPNWPLHAQRQLEPEKGFADWPEQAGWWLERREQFLGTLAD